jgi:hypothetical protein
MLQALIENISARHLPNTTLKRDEYEIYTSMKMFLVNMISCPS